MGDVRAISLSSHKTEVFKEYKPSGKNYVLNGKNNAGYDYVIDRYKYSPTNSAILDSYYSYIYGRGLTANYGVEQADQMAIIQKLFNKDTVRKIVSDYRLFHEASFEIILGTVGNEIAEINHLPKNKVVPSEVDDKGEIGSWWYSYDWTNVNKYPPVEIPTFKQGTKDKRSIFVIKEYTIDDFYFARPSYYSGLNYAELEEQISIYCINHIKNGLSAGYIININEGITDEEVKDKFERNVINKFTGSENANKFILSFNSNKDNATTLEAVTVSDAHQQYQFLTEEARKQLLTAHKVVSGAILGIQTATGFSSNADEIETAFNETMLNVIKPMQDTLTDGFEYVLGQNNITLPLFFEPLRSEDAESNKNDSSYNGAQISSAVQILENVKLGVLTKEQAMVFLIQFLKLDKDVAISMFNNSNSIQNLSGQKKSNLDTTIADELIKLGEDIDLEQWDLVSEAPIDYEDDEKFYNFATTGTAFPNAKSEQDTKDFKVRYKYNGEIKENSREFCRKMINASKIYRKEDIQNMNSLVVNEGWGEYGTEPYSIWKFKGGGACHHNWMRQIYVAKGVKVDVNSPLAEMININEARRKGFKKELNDKEAFVVPNNLPNNGFLHKR